MTDLLERLRALEAAATKGPWLQGTGSGGGATTYVYEDDGNGQQCNAIMGGTLNYVLRDFHEREANAALIVAMRNALPDLLARIETMAGEIEGIARELVDQDGEPWMDGVSAERLHFWRDKAIKAAAALRTALTAHTSRKGDTNGEG
jgi:hypothetical protein